MAQVPKTSSSDQAEKMAAWTEQVTREDSPLYAALGEGICTDADLLALLDKIPQQQPVPLLLFGAVHQLLLDGTDHALRNFYPTCTDDPDTESDPFPAFRDFVMDNYDTILDRATTRQVQTNEVGRSSLFLPVYRIIARRTNRPLWIIEIGASAGLNLLFDKWHYTYLHGTSSIDVGDPTSPVHLTTTIRGPQRPLFPDPMPEVAARIGVDLDPIDITDPADESWLRGLLWPDQAERHHRLAGAISVAKQNPLTLVRGDAVACLEEQIAAASENSTVVINHSHILNQLTEEVRDHFVAELDRLSAQRPIWRLSNEWLSRATTQLDLIRHTNGGHQIEGLADVHHHGTWISWQGPTR